MLKNGKIYVLRKKYTEMSKFSWGVDPRGFQKWEDPDPRDPGADPAGGRWGGRPPLGRRFSIEDIPFNSIQAPVNHWAPSPWRNPVSVPATPRRQRPWAI